MSRPFDAVVLRDGDGWSRDVVRLGVREKRGTTAAFLMPDGTWHTAGEGETAGQHGLLLPTGSIEAIAEAIQEWQGHTSHADTEARVLREWLAVERARVDRSLER
jgi:hypothetical protein